jgi:hypothetical protein
LHGTIEYVLEMLRHMINSNTAGRGNFFHESFTAVLERNLKDVFAAVGVGFEARNYAFADSHSGEEIALCAQSIFGMDADTLVWDFPMGDSSNFWRMMMYAYQAARIPGRPALLGMGIPGHNGRRERMLQKMEKLGMMTFHLDEDVVTEMKSAIPDTLGKSQTEIDQMPPFLRYMKCGGEIEAGEPGCGDHKFNLTACADRNDLAPWHPGW